MKHRSRRRRPSSTINASSYELVTNEKQENEFHERNSFPPIEDNVLSTVKDSSLSSRFRELTETKGLEILYKECADIYKQAMLHQDAFSKMLASVSFAWAARRQGLYQEAIDILQATIFPFSEQNPPSSVYEYAETVQFHILLMRTSLEAGNLSITHQAASSLECLLSWPMTWAEQDAYALSQLHVWCTLAEVWTKLQDFDRVLTIVQDVVLAERFDVLLKFDPVLASRYVVIWALCAHILADSNHIQDAKGKLASVLRSLQRWLKEDSSTQGPNCNRAILSPLVRPSRHHYGKQNHSAFGYDKGMQHLQHVFPKEDTVLQRSDISSVTPSYESSERKELCGLLENGNSKTKKEVDFQTSNVAIVTSSVSNSEKDSHNSDTERVNQAKTVVTDCFTAPTNKNIVDKTPNMSPYICNGDDISIYPAAYQHYRFCSACQETEGKPLFFRLRHQEEISWYIPQRCLLKPLVAVCARLYGRCIEKLDSTNEVAPALQVVCRLTAKASPNPTILLFGDESIDLGQGLAWKSSNLDFWKNASLEVAISTTHAQSTLLKQLDEISPPWGSLAHTPCTELVSTSALTAVQQSQRDTGTPRTCFSIPKSTESTSTPFLCQSRLRELTSSVHTPAKALERLIFHAKPDITSSAAVDAHDFKAEISDSDKDKDTASSEKYEELKLVESTTNLPKKATNCRNMLVPSMLLIDKADELMTAIASAADPQQKIKLSEQRLHFHPVRCNMSPPRSTIEPLHLKLSDKNETSCGECYGVPNTDQITQEKQQQSQIHEKQIQYHQDCKLQPQNRKHPQTEDEHKQKLDVNKVNSQFHWNEKHILASVHPLNAQHKQHDEQNDPSKSAVENNQNTYGKPLIDFNKPHESKRCERTRNAPTNSMNALTRRQVQRHVKIDPIYMSMKSYLKPLCTRNHEPSMLLSNHRNNHPQQETQHVGINNSQSKMPCQLQLETKHGQIRGWLRQRYSSALPSIPEENEDASDVIQNVHIKTTGRFQSPMHHNLPNRRVRMLYSSEYRHSRLAEGYKLQMKEYGFPSSKSNHPINKTIADDYLGHGESCAFYDIHSNDTNRIGFNPQVTEPTTQQQNSSSLNDGQRVRSTGIVLDSHHTKGILKKDRLQSLGQPRYHNQQKQTQKLVSVNSVEYFNGKSVNHHTKPRRVPLRIVQNTQTNYQKQ